MKNFLAIFLLSFITSYAYSQHSCCSHTTASFADDPLFVKAHLSPLPFHFYSEQGKMISYKTGSTQAGAYEVRKEGKKVILMFHEWWGLNDYIKQEAVRLSDATGATVIAPDLYDGKVAIDPEEAGRLYNALKEERGMEIIKGALNYIEKDKMIQTIGWCMGGKWSLQAAIEAGSRAKGCVMYYGMPETDLKRLENLRCPVLAIFADNDKWINKEVVAKFRADMKKVNRDIYIYSYKADHAFANPSNPQYDREATADAWAKAIEFLKKNYGEK